MKGIKKGNKWKTNFNATDKEIAFKNLSKNFCKGQKRCKKGAILLQFLLQIPSICLSCELLRSEPAFAR